MGISWFHRIISGSGRREEQREVQSRDQEEARRLCIAWDLEELLKALKQEK